MRQYIEVLEKHSLILRWCHWLNVLFLSLMIGSGILIYWADDAFIKLPSKFVEIFHINNRLAEGMGWHLFIMWPFVLNGIIYIFYLLFSGEWRHRFPDRKSFPEAIEVLLHDLKLRKTTPVIRGKYNGAQRIAYTGALLLGAGAVTSGLAIYKPVQLGWLTFLFGGYKTARLVHFLMMSGFVIFVFIHVVQVIRAGWNNFRSMIAGYEIEKS